LRSCCVTNGKRYSTFEAPATRPNTPTQPNEPNLALPKRRARLYFFYQKTTSI
jgi:hypothetical protein